MNRTFRSAAIAAAIVCLAASASAQVLSSPDFTPVNGTSWANVATTPVQLDFGSLGIADVSVTSFNGGGVTILGDNHGTPGSPTTLSNGALFAASTEVLFTINPTNVGLSGFTLTMSLESGGNFTPGSVFSTRSLDSYTGWGTQSVLPGTGLDTPDPVQLPTDGNNIPDLVLNPATGAYQNSVDGRSKGLAFGIDGNTFSATFMATAGFQPGGVAFTLAIPPAMTAAVPEPSTYALMFAGLGAIGFMARRRSSK